MASDVYFFDCDKTLYTYDFRKRLPALAALTGASEYHLARTWWVGGHEDAANAGEYRSTAEYLEVWQAVTGVPLTLEQWQESRGAAMAPIQGSLDALRRAATLGTVSLLSNNPIPFRDSLPVLAPEAAEILAGNDLVSAVLGAEKPERRIYTRALGVFGVSPENAILFDDSAENVAGARDLGMHAFQFTETDGVYDVEGLNAAIDAFATRER
ncbi:HAD-IA family hydrolase [Glaciibacter psychrotolerans]|uniref:Putative hydrolase of the HAD superfamily n=1 Tax=Glaciibacter psychrotolerans TaxID=670054 RepID=A0A7Z0J617_9MICO|nr:HAD-IA family hydrolase [Leifsonia psychrotolerans]NYJ20077.1 putative hydrolase of the HAD superfamily [Leifsonia psychrotolerans]